MAAKKFTRGTRVARSSGAEVLYEYIETQRNRLTDAEAILDCVICALDDDASLDASGPSYPSAVRIARELVHEAIDRLDSVTVKAVMATADVSAETSGEGQGKYGGVREEGSMYVH